MSVLGLLDHKASAAASRLRQSLALPIYTVALILSYASNLLGNLAAWIAGDPRPRSCAARLWEGRW